MNDNAERWYCYVNGQQCGPYGEEVLRAWAGDGSLKPTDYVWTEGLADWAPAESVGDFFASGAPALPVRKPHRGGTVLTLGILGIVPCFICGIIAWVMANADLREIDAGQMDPAGRGMTQAGKVCGIVGVCWTVGVLALYIVMFIFVFALAGSAAFFSTTEAGGFP